MDKHLTPIAVTGALAMFVSAAGAQTQTAAPTGADDSAGGRGTITFLGQVNGTTCEIGGLGANQTVVLPTVNTTELATPDATAGQTNFDIQLINCTGAGAGGASKRATAYFLNGSNVNEGGRLMNTADGDNASAVSIQLANRETGEPININTASVPENNFGGNLGNLPDTTIENGAATLGYTASYFAESANVGPTPVQTSVEYVLRYY